MAGGFQEATEPKGIRYPRWLTHLGFKAPDAARLLCQLNQKSFARRICLHKEMHPTLPRRQLQTTYLLTNALGRQPLLKEQLADTCAGYYSPFFSVSYIILSDSRSSLDEEGRLAAERGRGAGWPRERTNSELPQTADYTLSHLKDWDLEIMHL